MKEICWIETSFFQLLHYNKRYSLDILLDLEISYEYVKMIRSVIINIIPKKGNQLKIANSVLREFIKCFVKQ